MGRGTSGNDETMMRSAEMPAEAAEAMKRDKEAKRTSRRSSVSSYDDTAYRRGAAPMDRMYDGLVALGNSVGAGMFFGRISHTTVLISLKRNIFVLHAFLQG